jgi:hypothetical protein
VPPKKTEVKASLTVPDPEPQIAQQTSTTKSELTRQVTRTLPDPESSAISSMRRQIKPDSDSQFTSSMCRPFRSTRRPFPTRSSLVQAFRQILAQQNDAEYITLSSGDEDDNS